VRQTTAARLVVLAVDTSKSMRAGANWDNARLLAENVLEQELKDGDTCLLLTFQDRADEVGTYQLPEGETALKAAIELSVAKTPRLRTQGSFAGVRDFATKFFKERGRSFSECVLFLITDGAPSLKSKAFQPGAPRGAGSVRVYTYTYRGEVSRESSTPSPAAARVDIQPVGLSLRDGRWDFGIVSSGEACNPEFRLATEPPTHAKVMLTAEISDLSRAGVPIPGQSVEYSIDSGSQNGRSITMVVPPDGTDFALSIRPPHSAWSLRAQEEIVGRLMITATSDGGGMLSKWTGDFVFVVRNDMTKVLALGAVLLVIAVFGVALLWQWCSPKHITIREAGKRGAEQSFTVRRGGAIPLGEAREGFVLSGISKFMGTLRRRGLAWVVYPETGVRVDDKVPGAPKRVHPNVPFRLEAEGKIVELCFTLEKLREAKTLNESSWR